MSGLKEIGLIQNLREYQQQIRERTGEKYYEYEKFDEHIDSIWKERGPGLFCYDALGEEVLVESDRISFFIMDTGFKTASDRQEALFVGFRCKTPSKLDTKGWRGVEIGTKHEIISRYTGLEQYTSIKSFKPIAREIENLSGVQLDEKECAELINKSFETAREKGNLAVVENEYDKNKKISFFQITGEMEIENAKLFVKMGTSKNEASWTEWFGAFVVTEEALKDELLSYFCFHVGSFRFESLRDANNFFNDLAQKAMRENWKWSDNTGNFGFSQPILKSYLEYTYYRLKDEDANLDEQNKKIIAYGGKEYFNSGLLDRNFRQIIIAGGECPLEREIPSLGTCRWKLLSDLQSYSHNEHEIAKNFKENELPAIASYFTDYKQVVFDASLDIHTNDNHIFEEGVARGA